MGSYCQLTVENLELLWNKSDVIGMELFRPTDKKIIQPQNEDKYLVCQYSAPVSDVIDRLRSMGATVDEAKQGQASYVE